MRLFNRYLVLSVFFVLHGCFWSPKVKDTYPTNSLGASLLPSFKKLSDNCTLPIPSKIPSGMIDEDRLKSPVEIIDGSNLSRIFNFIYSNQDLENFSKEKSYPNRFISSSDNASPLPESNDSNIAYANTCITSLENIAKADGNADIATASIKAAIEAETNVKKRKDLVLLGGTFYSPFSSNAEVSQTNKINQWFRMLRAYENNSNLRQKDYWYLDNIEGWFVTWTTHLKGLVSLNTSSNINANSIAGSVSNQLSYGLSDSVKLDLTDFKFFLTYKKDGVSKNSGFVKLPSFEKIIDNLRNSASSRDFDDVDFRYAIPGSTQKHLQVIAGMPTFYCNYGLWGVEGEDLFLESIKTYSREDGENECQFTLNFTPGNINNLLPFIEKKYFLVYKDQANIPLKINASAIIPILNEPNLMAGKTTIGSDQSFSIPVRVESLQLQFTLEGMQPITGDLKCGVDKQSIILTSAQDQSGFWFINGTIPKLSSIADTCTLSASLRLYGKIRNMPKSFIRSINSSITTITQK